MKISASHAVCRHPLFKAFTNYDILHGVEDDYTADVVIDKGESVTMVFLLDVSSIKMDYDLESISRRMSNLKTRFDAVSFYILLHISGGYLETYQNDVGEWIESDMRVHFVMQVQHHFAGEALVLVVHDAGGVKAIIDEMMKQHAANLPFMDTVKDALDVVAIGGEPWSNFELDLLADAFDGSVRRALTASEEELVEAAVSRQRAQQVVSFMQSDFLL